MPLAPSSSRPPPLFVVAYSAEGLRLEGLIEADRPPPEWLDGRLNLRVAAPSGAFADFRMERRTDADYNHCLEQIGVDRAWSPSLTGTVIPPELEVWAPDETDVDVRIEGTVLAIVAEGAGNWDDAVYYAGIWNDDGRAAYVVNGARVYLDRDCSYPGQRFLPRALLDTGLAGAFWSFNEHGNSTASFLVAKRLLESEFAAGAESRTHDLAAAVAAAHAVLIHRPLLDEYGSAVLAALEAAGDYTADATLLKAFISMALIPAGSEDGASISELVLTAIRVTAARRPVFGETLRLLNDQFNVLVDIVRSVPSDHVINSDVKAVNAMLHACYVGGQSATYLGNLKLEADAGWRNVAASKKKTSQS